MKPVVAFFISIALQQVKFSQGEAICNANRIHEELIKTIDFLKIKEKAIPQKTGPQVTKDRQDDDDSELPYYVNAIGKVIGSVLAQNATNVIEESFGFIPPEVNKNIQHVLSVVAETVTRLRPTPAPTQPPPSVNTTTELDPQSVAEIEALLAYVLAEKVASDINVTLAEDSNGSKPFHKDVIIHATPEVTATEKSIPVPITARTFRPQQNISSVHSDTVNSSAGLAVYAPAYAPNYVETTTPIPLYAPAFLHQKYTVTPSSTTPRKVVRVITTTKAPAEDGTTTENVDATTEDDEDYDDADADNKKRSI